MATGEKNSINLQFVDCESEIFNGKVEYLSCTSADGSLSVYPNHAALLARILPGLVKILPLGAAEEVEFLILGGFLEVSANHINLLADIVERSEANDEAHLLKQYELALARLKSGQSLPAAYIARAEAGIEVALAKTRLFGLPVKKFKKF